MGSCHSNCIKSPNKRYDVRKYHDHRNGTITPTPSISDKMERFDTIEHISTSRSSKSTVRSSQVTPMTDITDPFSHKSNTCSSTLNSNCPRSSKKGPILHLEIPEIIAGKDGDSSVISRESSEILSSPEFAHKRCDSISDKSEVDDGDGDSDLGSECFSVAHSSARSEERGCTKKGEPVGKVCEVQPCGSLTSEESLSYGTLTRSRGRSAFNASRLGRREITAASSRSIDVLYWRKGDRLGSGSFGTVWLGLTNTGELIAVKQMQLQASLTDFREAEKEYDKIYQEVLILKTLMHRNIVGYLGSSYDNGNVSIFMEYVAGGSLGTIIQKFGPLEENIVSRYTRQLLDAITYMHRNSVVHRDIKSANIMLTPNGTIKLIDFGCAKKLELRLSRSGSHLMRSLRGTPYWMAPEVINETGHGKKSDIWSLGCTVFEMLTGAPPWGDREPIAAIFAIGSEEFPIPQLPDSCSVQARDFTTKCMLRDKHKRQSADRLVMHRFVASIQWEEEDSPGDLLSVVTSSRQTSIESSLSQYHATHAEPSPAIQEEEEEEELPAQH